MTNQFASILIKDKISDFRIRKPLCVNKADSLKVVLKKMKKERRGSALIEKNGKLVGIFTERDLLKRVIPNRVPLKSSIDTVMSEKPVTLCANDSMAMVLSVMNETGVRHIPIVHKTKGTIEGIISVRDVLDYLADHFPNEVYNLPPDLNQVSREPEGA
ncbi:MAG: CBS protein [uncultured bacterium]|nr:MAG: CBS protein [uncultured bacterium]